MNEILGVQIPSDLSAESVDALRQLRANLATAMRELTARGSLTTAEVEQLRAAKAMRAEILSVVEAAEADEAEVNDELDAIEAELAAEEGGDDSDSADSDDEDGEDDGEADDADAEASADDVEEVDEAEAVTAAAPPRTFNRRRPTAAAASAATSEDHRSLVPEQAPMIALPGSGIDAGSQFESTRQLAASLHERWQQLGGGSDERLGVARINAAYPDELRLVAGDSEVNFEKFGGLDIQTKKAQDAITAAVCAPAEPYYGLGCESSLARPVWNALPKYQAPRGNVSVYPSPKLSNIPTNAANSGRGIWTQADDANAGLTKAACVVIPCASTTTYGIYGAYMCMTVQNMNAMTYPELVEAYLNRLGAKFAQLRETALLDGMLASANLKNISAVTGVETASINTWQTFLKLLSAAREEERYDDVSFVGFAPRWVREALKVDLLRQKRIGGGFSPASRLATNAEVDAALREVGADITWTYDLPSSGAGWKKQDVLTDGGTVPDFPSTAKFILAPRGNFRALDGGNLTIGVTNNNIYRDNTSNSKNQFTMFMENFEGIIDFGCTSYELTIPSFCPHGGQVSDIAAVTCAAAGIS